MTELPTIGKKVLFRDRDNIWDAICNGESIVHDNEVFVPVHIPETNQNMMVNARNLMRRTFDKTRY